MGQRPWRFTIFAGMLSLFGVAMLIDGSVRGALSLILIGMIEMLTFGLVAYINSPRSIARRDYARFAFLVRARHR